MPPDVANLEGWLTYKQACDRLGISKKELIELNAAGDIFDHKVVEQKLAGASVLCVYLRESDVEHLRKQAEGQ